MPLILTLGRGVLTGIGKRPSPAAPLPPVRLTEPELRIDAARLAAYEKVCGFTPGGALPLTYPHILGFPLAARIMASRAFPLPLLGLVHTSIEIVRHHPSSAADRHELTVYAAELRPHPRGTEVVMVTEARLDGGLAWTDRSTYLARHRPAAPAGSAVAAAPAAGPGEPLPAVAVWRLPADLGRRHARVSSDYNPIHLYPLTAKPLGFPRAIAHGMWTIARCAAEFPAADAISAVFRRPVLLPATVTFAAAGPRFELRSGPHLHLRGTVAPAAPGGDRPGL